MFVFFFNDTATTEIYTLSLHDALPISNAIELGTPTVRARRSGRILLAEDLEHNRDLARMVLVSAGHERSEEHTSELQSRQYLVCRLLLEKKKNTRNIDIIRIDDS